MSFTDDDLKALRKLSNEEDTIYGFSVCALLARLEAAEIIANEALIDHGSAHQLMTPCKICPLLIPWRKAAGK